ncbi:MAG TPA: energy-coupling factor ABC transporter ATP-binding protein [Kosmotogaceae bacterium]|nr:MAG: ABC transporter related [Thermotogales bacterium 46_20]HAA85513.1 energy-coupling factor ABC transporter ATP-binding protein [Kosmotogaceae bacterium]
MLFTRVFQVVEEMLNFHGVSLYYGLHTPLEAVALTYIDFSLPRESVLLVNGHVGSGKTSLLLLASKLIKPTIGEVHLEPGIRSAVVFQLAEQQFFCETVREEVLYGPRNFRLPGLEDIYTETMKTVGLDPAEFSERSPFKLSGGEKRRVAIACALALSPDILVLDEPETSLDDLGLCDLLSLLREIRRNRTLIIATHWPEFYLDITTHMLVLDRGLQAFFGTFQDFLLDYSEKAIQTVTPKSPILERARETLQQTGQLPNSLEQVITDGRGATC